MCATYRQYYFSNNVISGTRERPALLNQYCKRNAFCHDGRTSTSFKTGDCLQGFLATDMLAYPRTSSTTISWKPFVLLGKEVPSTTRSPLQITFETQVSLISAAVISTTFRNVILGVSSFRTRVQSLDSPPEDLSDYFNLTRNCMTKERQHCCMQHESCATQELTGTQNSRLVA